MNESNLCCSIRRLATWAVLASPVVLVACANQGVTQSGFLRDYDQLAAAQKIAKALTYSKTDSATSPRLPRVVVIEPVEARLPAAQMQDTAPDLLRQAQADYRVALETAFAKGYRVVDKAPAEGAWHVRAAITGIKPSNPALNAATFLLLGPVSNGGVSTEAEVVDSATGERIAAQATFTNGHLFDGGLGGYFDKLGHIRKAFDGHAEKLRELAANRPAPSHTSTAQVAGR